MTGNNKSVLSPIPPDGVGFYYGYYKDRRIDVRRETNGTWSAFIDGLVAGDGWTSKDVAEEAAKRFIDQGDAGISLDD